MYYDFFILVYLVYSVPGGHDSIIRPADLLQAGCVSDWHGVRTGRLIRQSSRSHLQGVSNYNKSSFFL